MNFSQNIWQSGRILKRGPVEHEAGMWLAWSRVFVEHSMAEHSDVCTCDLKVDNVHILEVVTLLMQLKQIMNISFRIVKKVTVQLININLIRGTAYVKLCLLLRTS
jgi:hypothetical protein